MAAGPGAHRRRAQGLAQGADSRDPPEAGAETGPGGGDRGRQGRALRGRAGSDGHAAAEPGAEGGAARQAAFALVTANPFHSPGERALSGAMALVMHVLFFALLVFGVSWQKRQPEAMVVDLWNNLPPVSAPKPEPAPEVKPEPERPPAPKVEAKPVPKAQPKSEPKPVAKPVAKAEPKPAVKPDIALLDKKEKERKAQQQALAEKEKRE